MTFFPLHFSIISLFILPFLLYHFCMSICLSLFTPIPFSFFMLFLSSFNLIRLIFIVVILSSLYHLKNKNKNSISYYCWKGNFYFVFPPKPTRVQGVKQIVFVQLLFCLTTVRIQNSINFGLYVRVDGRLNVRLHEVHK